MNKKLKWVLGSILGLILLYLIADYDHLVYTYKNRHNREFSRQIWELHEPFDVIQNEYKDLYDKAVDVRWLGIQDDFLVFQITNNTSKKIKNINFNCVARNEFGELLGVHINDGFLYKANSRDELLNEKSYSVEGFKYPSVVRELNKFNSNAIRISVFIRSFEFEDFSRYEIEHTEGVSDFLRFNYDDAERQLYLTRQKMESLEKKNFELKKILE